MIKDFLIEKKRMINKMNNLYNQIAKIEKLQNLELQDVKEKIKTEIDNIKNEKFSIAFFGAFSDGKSTILSVLLNNLDIKISPEPATDKINTYTWGEYFIIDTPGLYSDELLHDEKTIKYISEANIIIYTLDSVNPIKRSHYKTVKWLIEDLDKSNSIIFVINKMDQIADLEDERDFLHNCNIKKHVVINTLKDIVTVETIPEIVCVSADPGGKGLQEWFENRNEYFNLSRINNLNSAINKIVSQNKNRLIIKTGMSVIYDAVNFSIEQLNAQNDSLLDQIEIFDNQIEEFDKKYKTMQKDIRTNYIAIKDDIINLRESLFNALGASIDLESLRDFVDKYIGKDGYIINQKINMKIEKYTDNLIEEEQAFVKGINESIKFHQDIMVKLAEAFAKSGSKFGAKILEKSTRELGNIILKTRNWLKLPIKFKPWGAIKFANKMKGFAKFLQWLGPAFDTIETIDKILKEKRYQKTKKDLKNNIEDIFKSFIEGFTLKKYIESYFPTIYEIESLLKSLKKIKEDYNKTAISTKNSIRELSRFIN